MEIARAVIVATPAAHDRPWCTLGDGPKPLVDVANRPILFHTLDALRSAGVLEAALLTEPRTAELFHSVVGDGGRWGMSIDYRQSASIGDVCSALTVADDFIDGEPVIVLRADALLRGHLREQVVSFAREDLDAVALMLLGARTQGLRRRMAGAHLLGPSAVSIMRDSLGAGDTMSRLRLHGRQVRVLDVDGCLACDGSDQSLLDANRYALSNIVSDLDGADLEDCEIQGPVVVHPGATLRNTLVRGPAIIGPRSRLADSYVGPYTSIGADARLEGTEIEHSIVMDGASLRSVGSRLETSIIGRGASITRRFDLPSAVRMSIGDGAQVALG
ncbi:MAG TPA: sugar phosphate nucleotidyltransferase [Solirubrobacteraceae bacterium]|jgi:glucose-1-phosphate thymidylyltransferase|nr:sugar phosphate nucleotidyltransferase [Solirubrobacteraceae bacterium]